jgi:hypothetical protein
MKKTFCAIFFLVLVHAGQAQWKTDLMPAVKGVQPITGDLRTDFAAASVCDMGFAGDSIRTAPVKRYSPLKAGLLSAVVPGAGQWYTKSYWQSMIFFGVEVGMWVMHTIYQNKADRQTNDFQTYADARWSVVRYVNWIQLNFPADYVSGVITSTDADKQSKTPWDCVDWTVLHQIEENIAAHAKDGDYYGFTHDLPMRPEQQYYELIGKYSQFVGGWDDAWTGTTYTDADVLSENVTKNFLSYRDMRGKANTYYSIASTASYVLVANHVLSAMEAAWNASHKNHQMQLRSSIEHRLLPDRSVEFIPTFSMAVDF